METAKHILAALAAAALSAAAAAGAAPDKDGWLPAADWTDRPDPAASPAAKRGGTVRFNGAQPPKSYNAYVDNNSYTRMVFDLMYENLLSIDRETLEFLPGLARRWKVSPDGRSFTFQLDPRAAWSDGTPVTARDVKWTFDAVMDPASDTGSWKTMLGTFESPSVVDDMTVTFRKTGDSPKNWRDLLTVAGFWILPRHAYAGTPFNRTTPHGRPVSGAYTLARVDEQVECELRRSPRWWREGFPSSKGLFNFDRIVLRYYADNENAFEALKKKAIDAYPVYSARIMHEGTLDGRFARNWILKRRVRNRSAVGFQGFAMNMRRPPFDRLEVRQAMAKLVDRRTMNDTMMDGEYFLQSSYYGDLYGEGRPCKNPAWEYDVEGAKALLAKAGLSKGFTFTFLSRSAGEDKFLSLFSHALRACGVRMEIVRKDFAAWMRDMDAYNFDMTWAAWGAGTFRDPEPFWKSSEGARPGGNNLPGFADPRVDAIIEAEKSMDDPAERDEALREIDAIVAAAVPYVLLWNTDEHRILYWNRFGMPERPLGIREDESGILAYWWHDADRAEELETAMKGKTCLPAITD